MSMSRPHVVKVSTAVSGNPSSAVNDLASSTCIDQAMAAHR